MSSKDEPLTINTNETNNYNLSSRFTSVQPLGYGSSGLVLSAHDEHLNKKVAIKRIAISDSSTNKQALREVKFMCQLEHDNIVPVYEILGPACEEINLKTVDLKQIQFVHIVEEHLDTDLHHLIRGRHIDENYAKWFLYQLLRGLKYIHSANLIHRDLKPSNLLIDCHELLLKISDFGLCRVLDPKYDHKGYLTENVGTCWYRSPEQILSPSDYNKAIDLWSAGCVFAEMLLGGPLFTGANELNQMIIILDTIHLDEEDWSKVLSVMPNKLLKNHPFRPRTPLGEKFTDIDPKALDLLEQLLTFDPIKRCTIEEALSHPYLAEYSEGDLEPKAEDTFHIEHEVDDCIASTSPPPQINHESNSCVTEPCNRSSSPPINISLTPSSPAPPPSDNVRASMSPTPPPISASPPTIQLDETHTLDEILNLPENATIHSGSINSSRSHRSSGSNSVEDLNMRNLAQSQENLAKTPSYQNILTISDEQEHIPEQPYHHRDSQKKYSHSCMIIEDAENYYNHNSDQSNIYHNEWTVNEDTFNRNTGRQRNIEYHRCDRILNAPDYIENNAHDEGKSEINKQFQDQKKAKEEDEKDVAEISQEKLAEDEEIESVQSEPLEENESESKNSTDTAGVGINYYSELRVNIEDTENYKEYSQVGHKEEVTSYSSGGNLPAANQSAKPKMTQSNRYLNNNETSEESVKEKKLLEFYKSKNILSKLEAETNENEKSKKKHGNRNGHNAEFDEMYRLPTEHLCMDRDYSNERIKQKHIAKMHRQQRQCLARYRDELNELNERLKEASLDGAVGGVELPEEPHTTDLFVTTNISISEPISEHAGTTVLNVNGQFEVDIVNQQCVVGERRTINSNDGFSSPEELPSSPRGSFSRGARPKKSPRKQKAL